MVLEDVTWHLRLPCDLMQLLASPTSEIGQTALNLDVVRPTGLNLLPSQLPSGSEVALCSDMVYANALRRMPLHTWRIFGPSRHQITSMAKLSSSMSIHDLGQESRGSWNLLEPVPNTANPCLMPRTFTGTTPYRSMVGRTIVSCESSQSRFEPENKNDCLRIGHGR